MEITRGKMNKAQKVVIYGPEGIGKTTFAAKFPRPVFIDTEGSTANYDLNRFNKPLSWTMLMKIIDHVRTHPDVCGTLVIDTADWAQILCVNELISQNSSKGINGIEDFGYGKGYTYLAEKYAKMLNLLQEVCDAGVNAVITAHAMMRKFEQPDETGAYDRWELKLEKKLSALTKEWADMVLFANYKTTVIKDENKKTKAYGGERVMYTTHHPCWDAKNRHGLPECLPFDYEYIKQCIPDNSLVPVSNDTPIEAVLPPVEKKETTIEQTIKETISSERLELPPALVQLMEQYHVTEEMIQRAVASKGYFPMTMPISDYPKDFIDKCLIAAWDQVYKTIEDDELPF